jgi:repressor of nif and glnA expression
MAVSSAGADGFEQVMTLETGHGDRVANMRTFARTALELFEQALAR